MIEQRRTTKFYTMPEHHFHDFYEIYYLLSGERFYFIKDRTYLVRKVDLVFIDKYDLHKTAHTKVPEHERILINFKEDFVSGYNEETGTPYQPGLFAPFRGRSNIISLNPEEQSFVKMLLFNMLKERKDQYAQYETYIGTLLIQLLIFSGRLMEKAEPDFVHASPLHQKISEVMAYINKSFTKSLTLEAVSRKFFMSPFYLSRAFKQVTGFSFVVYINTVRIEEAQRLLRESNKKVTLIADQVGFESLAHFSRVFKRIVSLTPLEYRKLMNFKTGRP